MQHLNGEDLARLADEAPSNEEAQHLAACAECAAELAALREQVHTLATLPDMAPPARLEQAVQAALEGEGLRLARANGRRRAIRIAASVALFAAGGLAGFLGRGFASAPVPPPVAVAPPPPADAAEAATRLQTAEVAYATALGDYARLTDGLPAPDPVNRLAALEGIVLTTRAALNEAPADPVINGYHLTALEQRDAILREIGWAEESSVASNQEWY